MNRERPAAISGEVLHSVKLRAAIVMNFHLVILLVFNAFVHSTLLEIVVWLNVALVASELIYFIRIVDRDSIRDNFFVEALLL